MTVLTLFIPSGSDLNVALRACYFLIQMIAKRVSLYWILAVERHKLVVVLFIVYGAWFFGNYKLDILRAMAKGQLILISSLTVN